MWIENIQERFKKTSDNFCNINLQKILINFEQSHIQQINLIQLT